jgi:hypothetical protein
MKNSLFGKVGVFIAGLFLLLIPAITPAESQQAPQGSPPIEQPLIREGTLAVKLAPALGLGITGSEAEAETLLAEKGISPRNGWIADYPVTPDIIGELQKAVGDAADAGNIPVSRTEALNRFEDIITEFAIGIQPQDENAMVSSGVEGEGVVAPADIYNYYYEQGPPVVTYYAPPYDYYDLYSWVPYPFWFGGFWFGGFFILNDFHRTVFIGDNHHRAFVSNHFRGKHGVFSIDPVARFHGQTRFHDQTSFHGRSNVGIGTSNRINSVPAGVQGSLRSNFTAPRTQVKTGVKRMNGSWQSAPQVHGVNRAYTPFSHVNGPPVQSNPNSGAFSRSNNSPVRSFTPSRRNFPGCSSGTCHRYYSPAHNFTPSAGNNVPMRSNAPSRSFTPALGHTPSSHGISRSGSSFRGGGGFAGGRGSR